MKSKNRVLLFLLYLTVIAAKAATWQPSDGLILQGNVVTMDSTMTVISNGPGVGEPRTEEELIRLPPRRMPDPVGQSEANGRLFKWQQKASRSHRKIRDRSGAGRGWPLGCRMPVDLRSSQPRQDPRGSPREHPRRHRCLPASWRARGLWCTNNPATGAIADRPVYSDDESFRNVSWLEAVWILAHLLEINEDGGFRPQEIAEMLRLAALKWGGRERKPN